MNDQDHDHVVVGMEEGEAKAKEIEVVVTDINHETKNENVKETKIQNNNEENQLKIQDDNHQNTAVNDNVKVQATDDAVNSPPRAATTTAHLRGDGSGFLNPSSTIQEQEQLSSTTISPNQIEESKPQMANQDEPITTTPNMIINNQQVHQNLESQISPISTLPLPAAFQTIRKAHTVTAVPSSTSSASSATRRSPRHVSTRPKVIYYLLVARLPSTIESSSPLLYSTRTNQTSGSLTYATFIVAEAMLSESALASLVPPPSALFAEKLKENKNIPRRRSYSGAETPTTSLRSSGTQHNNESNNNNVAKKTL
jgi:hypothetical protein